MMERRMRWKSHVRCGAGEKVEIASKPYLLLYNTIREKMDFQGEPAVYKSGKYRGQPMHYDREEEYVKGLRNILKDLASNVLIRRVLFGKSDFDFDVHVRPYGHLEIQL